MGTASASVAVRLWSSSELRRRWLALVLLGILAGLAAGLAIAAIDGAGRTTTAYERMRTRYGAADAVFFPSQIGIGDADITKLGELPEVAAYGGFSLTPSEFDEIPGAGPIVLSGADWFTTLEGAKVLSGRLPDPSRDDEAVINEPAVASGGHIGAVLTFRSLSVADEQALNGADPPPDYDWSKATGPLTKLHIVGVIRQPMESVLSFASETAIYPGPGWAAAHLAETAPYFTNALVRLRNGAADMPKFQADVARIYGRSDIPIKDLSDDIKRVNGSLDVERTALLLFAGAVILAGAVLVGQAFVRSVRAGSDSVPVLRAMGLGHGGLVAGLVAPHIVTIVVTAVTAAATAVLLSTRFPIGLAHKLDPSLGFHVNAPLLALGILATIAATSLGCALVAWLTVRRLSHHHRIPRTKVIGAATRAGAPVPAAVGASLALEQAPSRIGATARPALIAAIIGVFGIVGAVTLVSGIDDALHRPERVGRAWDLEAPIDDSIDLKTAEGVVTANHDVAAVGLLSRFAGQIGGKDAPFYSVQGVEGSMRFTLLDGRAPEGDDELALGPRTASLLHAHIGDRITVGAKNVPMTVVGITLLAQTPHSSFDEGAWVTTGALDAVTGTTLADREDELLIRVRPGASTAAVASTLGEHRHLRRGSDRAAGRDQPRQRAKPPAVPRRVPRTARRRRRGPRPPDGGAVAFA